MRLGSKAGQGKTCLVDFMKFESLYSFKIVILKDCQRMILYGWNMVAFQVCTFPIHWPTTGHVDNDTKAWEHVELLNPEYYGQILKTCQRVCDFLRKDKYRAGTRPS